MVPNHQPDNELYHCSDSSYMDLNGSQWTVDILDFHQFEKSRNITRPGKLTVCELEHGPVEIVSFPMKNRWVFQFANCKRLPGRVSPNLINGCKGCNFPQSMHPLNPCVGLSEILLGSFHGIQGSYIPSGYD